MVSLRDSRGEHRDPSRDRAKASAGAAAIGEDISPIMGVPLATLFFGSIQALLIVQGHPALLDGELWDPDT